MIQTDFGEKKNQPISCINCKFVQALHSQFIALCINIIIKLSLNGLPISFVTIQKTTNILALSSHHDQNYLTQLHTQESILSIYMICITELAVNPQLRSLLNINSFTSLSYVISYNLHSQLKKTGFFLKFVIKVFETYNDLIIKMKPIQFFLVFLFFFRYKTFFSLIEIIFTK